MAGIPRDVWASGDAYEPFIGRWSRLVAKEFLRWLAIPQAKHWVEIGCGTGALTQTILAEAAPASVRAADASEGFAAYARAHVTDARASFAVADARTLPPEWGDADAVVSGLVLNFIPEPSRAVAEMRRVVRPGGIVAAYVWDYASGMEMLRRFWDAAKTLDPAAEELDEARRFAHCDPESLAHFFRIGGLVDVETRAIDVPTVFRDFEDFWTPFTGGQGPAPSYAASLGEEERDELRETIRNGLQESLQESLYEQQPLKLTARAWAVRGTKPTA